MIKVVLYTLVVLCFASSAAITSGSSAQLPSAVVSRLKKIDQHLSKVEDALKRSEVDHMNMRSAKQYFEEIERQYPVHVNSPEVAAARERIAKNESGIEELQNKKKADKEKEEQGAKSAEKVAMEWATRLSAYQANTTLGAKGDFGVPLGTVEDVAARRAHYIEAKSLYEEFKRSGIDKDSHYQLRDAEYDIRIAIENYEKSIERLFSQTEKRIKDQATWINGQRASKSPLTISTLSLMDLREKYRAALTLIPADNPRSKALASAMAELEKDQAYVESVVLKDRKMKPDAFKGTESASIKGIAKGVVSSELAKSEYGGRKGQIARIHIISPTWNTESAVEWTDTTRSALQYRVTKGVNVQVAVVMGQDCFLFTLFMHKDSVGGSQGGIVGHVMFRDKFLASNLPK